MVGRKQPEEHGTYMVMRNVVEEVAADPAEEGSVDGGECTSKESPLPTAIMRDSGIGMVQVCEHNDPYRREIRESSFRVHGGYRARGWRSLQ